MDTETVQIYYKINVRTGVNNDDISVAEEKEIFPELLSWYGPTWFARNFPQNEEDLPEGVSPAHHFITWDRKKGTCLCVGYYFDPAILDDTEAFKDTLRKIIDDASGQFSDGWGEGLEQRDVKVGRKEYSPQVHDEVVSIVAPVPPHENFLVRWKSVDEIEHVEWMLHYDNDAFNIVYNKAEHEKKVQWVKDHPLWNEDKLEMYAFIEANKKHFFVPGWRTR